MANDHYVPQFYLRNFQAAPGRIWCYEVDKRPSLKGIKSVASEEDYYALKKDIHGIDSNLIDDLFKEVESYSAPIIRKLIGMNKLELSNDDYNMMAFFIASLSNRTPSFQQNQIKAFESLFNHVNSLVTSNKDRFRAVAKKAGIDIDNESPEQIEEIRQLLMKGLQIDEKKSKHMLLGIAIKTVFDGLAEIIYHKEWHLLQSDGSKAFITSDNPVVLLPPKGHHPADGLGFIQASILLTISPTRALLLRDQLASSDILKVNTKLVDMYNAAIIMQADKQIFSNDQNSDLEKAFTECQEEKKVFIKKFSS